MDGENIGRLVYLGLLLAAVGGWVIVEYRQRLGQALRVALAWALIFVGVAAGYALWTDIRPDAAARQMVTDAGTLSVTRSRDGHYYLDAQVNGTSVEFLADTGASNIVLSTNDARRLGIDPDALVFLGEAMTANGLVRTARVVLPNLVVGPFTDRDVPVWVTDGDMDISLMGMDYLGRFRMEFAEGEMILSR